jgi:hypothetical protein
MSNYQKVDVHRFAEVFKALSNPNQKAKLEAQGLEVAIEMGGPTCCQR